MNNNTEKLEIVYNEIRDVLKTAKNVNEVSHQRKDISADSVLVIQFLISKNKELISQFEQLYQYLNISHDGIIVNYDQFKINVKNFSEVIDNFNDIKMFLDRLRSEINKLTKLVNIIQDDTDEIFSLALNASIVSSKFSSRSGVFDILATKLNDMSNFINKNLENIVKVVGPITTGVRDIVDENSYIITDIEHGYEVIQDFPEILSKQRNAIKELLEKANVSKAQIHDQQKKLEEISDKVLQMEKDADGAITGSGSVVSMSDKLKQLANSLLRDEEIKNSTYISGIKEIKEQGNSIWNTAKNVNEKSRSQLDFSLSCVEFSDSIISESVELKKAAEVFNKQFIENNQIANTISVNLSELITQLNELEKRIVESNKTIQKFNSDYKEIVNIVEFLKNVLKSMHLIGMYSRIESSRDEEVFSGFMTISDNISELQNNIQSNIPIVEDNINKTYELIESVNEKFSNVSSVFYRITESSKEIIGKFSEIITVSSESETISSSFLDGSKKINEMLEKLRSYLLSLADIVKKPIEGSAANIERGKKIEQLCSEIYEEKRPEKAIAVSEIITEEVETGESEIVLEENEEQKAVSELID